MEKTGVGPDGVPAEDSEDIRKALDLYIEAHTFLQWMVAGRRWEGETPATAIGEMASRWPGFLELRRARGSDQVDLVSDFQEWLDSHVPAREKPWWPVVEKRASTDPRLQGAQRLASAKTRQKSSPEGYADYQEWRDQAWTALKERPQPSLGLRPMSLPSQTDGHYHCGSDGMIQGLREVIAQNTFMATEDSPWPTAALHRGESKGIVQLRPIVLDEQPILPPDELTDWQSAMWQQREELSDLDVDTLDALNAIWLNQATNENHSAVATVDMILEMRGLKPKKGGRGTRGGFEVEQRHETMLTLGHLQNVWVTMAAVRTYELLSNGKRKRTTRAFQSRAFVITDRSGQLRFDGYIDVDMFVFRPGDVIAHVLFGPGRQTALMSARALQFNPHSQTWEKRLTRYLSWQWRCRARQGNYEQPFKVSTLLATVANPDAMARPARTRERFEKAMDVLQSAAVIKGWHYDRWDEEAASRKEWFPVWKSATVRVEPPDLIRSHYAKLEDPSTARAIPSLPSSFIGEQLERRRKQVGMSQAKAAALFGISQSYWSLLAKGRKSIDTLSPSVRVHLQTWLEGRD